MAEKSIECNSKQGAVRRSFNFVFVVHCRYDWGSYIHLKKVWTSYVISCKKREGIDWWGAEAHADIDFVVSVAASAVCWDIDPLF